jgi:polysaccharide biosynthesis protein PslG
MILATGVCAAIAWVGALSTEPTRVISMEIRETASIVVSRKTVGFADSDMYFMSATDVNKTLDMMQSAGVNTVRVMIPWAGIEKTQGTYNWTAVDTIVNAANARGMSVLGMINATPQWAAQPGQPALSGPPASNAVFADFTKRVATRYVGKVSAYEVWNEQNATVFWSTGPDPAAYTQMLKAVYPAIKAGDPNATVLVGGLSPLPHAQGMMNPVDYLKGMYTAGAKGYFDALAYHPYATTTFSQSYYTSGGALNVLIKLRQVMVAKGDAKLIWATEYGAPTGPGLLTEQQQADWIKNFLTKWRQYSYLGPSYIYTTRDSPFNSDTFGVWRENWTAKPAVAVILSFTGGPIQTAQRLAMAMMAGSETNPAVLPRLLAEAINVGVVSAKQVSVALAAMTWSALHVYGTAAHDLIAGVLRAAQQAVTPTVDATESSPSTLAVTLDQRRSAESDSLRTQSESETPGSDDNESTKDSDDTEPDEPKTEEPKEPSEDVDKGEDTTGAESTKETSTGTTTKPEATTNTDEPTKADETKADDAEKSDAGSDESSAA